MIRSGFVDAVFVLTFAGWGSVDSERHAAEVALGNGDMMAPLMAPSGDCYQCRDCVGDKHDIVEGLPENNKWESSHLETCNPGDCDLHDECGVTLAQLNEIWISGQEGLWCMAPLVTSKWSITLAPGAATDEVSEEGPVQVCEVTVSGTELV